MATAGKRTDNPYRLVVSSEWLSNLRVRRRVPYVDPTVLRSRDNLPAIGGKRDRLDGAKEGVGYDCERLRILEVPYSDG